MTHLVRGGARCVDHEARAVGLGRRDALEVRAGRRAVLPRLRRRCARVCARARARAAVEAHRRDGVGSLCRDLGRLPMLNYEGEAALPLLFVTRLLTADGDHLAPRAHLHAVVARVLSKRDRILIRCDGTWLGWGRAGARASTGWGVRVRVRIRVRVRVRARFSFAPTVRGLTSDFGDRSGWKQAGQRRKGCAHPWGATARPCALLGLVHEA